MYVYINRKSTEQTAYKKPVLVNCILSILIIIWAGLGNQPYIWIFVDSECGS